jgi:hypothetical protein
MAMKLSNPDEPTAAAVEAAIAAIPDELPAAPPSRPWLPMDDAPKDGTIIESKADPDEPDAAAVLATWRTTRRRNTPPLRGWGIVGFWCHPIGHAELEREPFVWRMMEGGVLPVGVKGQM